MTNGKGIRQNDETASRFGSKISDSAFELPIVEHPGCDHLHIKRGGRGLGHPDERSSKWRHILVEKQCDALHSGGNPIERFQPFSAHREFEIEKSGNVAARSRQIGDEPTAEWIDDVDEYDRNGLRFIYECSHGRCQI